MGETRQKIGINVGSASIVMVFAVLCLTIFSVLSFVTANHERKLAEKTAEAVQQYYQADWKAEMYYEELEKQLQEGVSVESLSGLDMTVQAMAEETQIQYAVPVDDAQELQVQLTVLPNRELQVKQWTVVAVKQWDYDETIPVWDGE